MVSKIAAKDRSAKCSEAEIDAANSAPLPSAGLNENIILIIYLSDPEIPAETANSASWRRRELAASAPPQQPSWLVNHD
jgi:hypothetical protein